MRLSRTARKPHKLLFWDGRSLCLCHKVLETGCSIADGTARLTAAQLAMLWEGIDWQRPSWTGEIYRDRTLQIPPELLFTLLSP